MTEEGENKQKKDEAFSQLVSEWRIASVRANRYDRNLLQYGAAMAAVIGVFGASTGVFAVANSLQKEGSTLPMAIIWASLSIGLFLFTILGLLLTSSYIRRQNYEREAEAKLKDIVKQDPYRFLPQAGSQ